MRTAKDYLIGISVTIGVLIIIGIAVARITHRGYGSTPRAIDTIDVGTTPNDGTGDPLRTAFLKVNRLIVMADSLDLDSLTNAEVQVLRNAEDLEDQVLFYVGDTTVTAAIGKIVFKTSNAHFYGCVATSGLKWKQLDN